MDRIAIGHDGLTGPEAHKWFRWLGAQGKIEHVWRGFDRWLETSRQPILNNGIVVMVTGDLIANGNPEQSVKYSQVFALLPTPTGGWYIANDIFRSAANATALPPNAADKSGASSRGTLPRMRSSSGHPLNALTSHTRTAPTGRRRCAPVQT